MIKIQQLVKVTIVTTVALFPSTVFAQVAPDSSGDYSSWTANWIVVAKSGPLNCRSGPGTNYRITTKFPRASSLTTSSELVGDNIRRDKHGRPWVRIKWAGTGSACYVRANVSFIGAMDDFTHEQAVCVGNEVRRGLSFFDAAFSCVD